MDKSKTTLRPLIVTGLFSFILLLSSCNRPEEVGPSEIEQNLQVSKVTYNSFDGKSLYFDSVDALNRDMVLVGSFNDPQLGSVSASSYFQLRLSRNNVLLGNDANNPVFDSIVLHLSSDYLIGNSGGMEFDIYELEDGFSDTAEYFTSTRLTIDSTDTIGSYNDSNPVTDLRVFNIRLDSAFGQKIFDLPVSDLQSNIPFFERVPGVALIPRVNSNHILGFGVRLDSSFATIYWHNDNGPQEFNLLLDIASDRSNYVRSGLVSNFNLTTSYDSILPGSLNGHVIVQNSSAFRPFINFREVINQFRQLGDEVAINDAELFIPVASTGLTFDNFPDQAFLYEVDEESGEIQRSDGFLISVTENDVNPFIPSNSLNPEIASYNATKGGYTFKIGRYFQEMVVGNKPDLGVIFAPFGNGSDVSQARIPVGQIRLDVYFTSPG